MALLFCIVIILPFKNYMTLITNITSNNQYVILLLDAILITSNTLSLLTLPTIVRNAVLQMRSHYIIGQYTTLEKAMAPHSSTLAWKIPWTEKPGRLQSMGSLRVRHEWATSLSLFTFMHWRRKWHSTPVFLPGESQGQESLVDCSLWGRRESDTTEAT